MNQSSDQCGIMLLDVIAFHDWLSKRCDQVVGRSANEESCPLARFLSETCGVTYIVDGSFYHLAAVACASVELPAWAMAFTRRLDFTYAGDEVSGEQALRLLPLVTESEGVVGEEYCWVHQPGGWTCVECRLNRQLLVQAEAIACYASEKGFPLVQTARTHRLMIVGALPDVFVEPFSSFYDTLQGMIGAFNKQCPFLTGAGVLVTRLL